MDSHHFNIHSFTSGQQMLHFLQQGSMQIRVMENQEYRWLLFDEYLQTVVDKAHPQRPVLPHINALLLSFYYQPSPKSVVELGLGGGALARYFDYHLPTTTFTSIEYQQSVIDTYKQYFQPPNNHQIHKGDAQQQIKTMRDIDILFVDLFSAHGSPAFVYESAFYQDCLQSLSATGVLAVNVVPELQLQSDWVLDILTGICQRKPDVYSAPGFKNRILLLPLSPEYSQLQYNEQLVQLSQRLDIDLNAIVKLR